MRIKKVSFVMTLLVTAPYTQVILAGESIYEYGQPESTRIELVSLPEGQQKSGGKAGIHSSISSEPAWTSTPLTQTEPIPEAVAASHSIPTYPVKAAAQEEEKSAAGAPVQQTTGPTVEERLAALTKIRVQGEISGDDYLAARKKILFGP